MAKGRKLYLVNRTCVARDCRHLLAESTGSMGHFTIRAMEDSVSSEIAFRDLVAVAKLLGQRNEVLEGTIVMADLLPGPN
ncbi:hypothetical protein VTI28DRAFT_8697 [Corynascus sepedonium]